MNLYDWAENECRLACKKENPDYNFDSNDFDYGCSCYKSALKAYKSLLEDGHRGTSRSFTKRILERLMDNQPLTPITDADFFSVERGTEAYPLESNEYLKERGLKSELQCPRMSSLFRTETLDGQVSYHDIDRYYYVDIENPSDTYGTSADFLDKMFPITMPYKPEKGKYVIYAQTFLSDAKNGDFDTKGIIYMETPNGERIDIDIYLTEKDGKMTEITKEEYDRLLERRVDRLNKKVAGHILFTLLSNSASDEEIERRERAYNGLSLTMRNGFIERLDEMCKFFENPEHYQYNTFGMKQALCTNDIECFKDIPELVEIANYLQTILKVIA